MKSKMTRMLEHLKKYPKQKYGQLQTTLYNLDTKKSKQLKKAPQGWNCYAIGTMINKRIIAKDKDKLYSLTKHGEKKINHPYSVDIEDRYKILQRQYEALGNRYDWLVAENHKLREFNSKIKFLIQHEETE